jgi:hypothetical protein
LQIIDIKQMQKYYGTQVTKRKLPTGGIAQGKETKTCIWLMCSLYRKEYRNVKLAGSTMGRGLKRSEEDLSR